MLTAETKNPQVDWTALLEDMKTTGCRFGYHSAPAPNTSTAGIVGTTAALLPIYKKYFVETNLASPTIRIAPKLSSENFWFYKEYVTMDMNDVIDMCPPAFDVLSGDDGFTLPLMAIGGKGVISVASNVVPADMAAMVEAARAGDFKKAGKLHKKMSRLFDLLFIEVNPTPVKAALAMMGKIEYEYRLPLCPMAQANYEKLKEALLDYGLIT